MKNNRTVEDFTDYNFKDLDGRLAEHETLFAFNNDMGNYAFNEWWNSVGYDMYKQWCLVNLEELSEDYG